MKQSLRAIGILALAMPASAAMAQGTSPVLRLGAEDLAGLGRGEAVIREVGDARALSLTASGANADEIRSRVAALKPNYLSEVMFSAPAAEGAVDSLARALADVKGYTSIRYWSKRQRTTYDLFDKMEISSRTAVPGGERIEVLQHMEPFADFGCRYAYWIAAPAPGKSPELFFECENTSPISYKGVSAVSPGHMLWMLYAFPSQGRIVFYGVGAVRAFDMFGVIRDRLETSFMGRVEAFFGHMSKKLN